MKTAMVLMGVCAALALSACSLRTQEPAAGVASSAPPFVLAPADFPDCRYRVESETCVMRRDGVWRIVYSDGTGSPIDYISSADVTRDGVTVKIHTVYVYQRPVS